MLYNIRLPEVSFSHKHVSLRSYGDVFDYDPKEDDPETPLLIIEALAHDAGAQNVLWQRLANDRYRESRFSVLPRNVLPRNEGCFGTINHRRLDGVILTRRGDATAFITRDCPVLVLYSARGGDIAVLHCSRSSLQGIDLGNPRHSVIANALRLCLSSWKNETHVRGIITTGIAAHHFNNERNPTITETLRAMWGDRVVPDRTRHTIDLVALIRAQLESHGIDPECIAHDGVDTYSDERFASLRAGRGGHNVIVVTHQ